MAESWTTVRNGDDAITGDVVSVTSTVEIDDGR
jgi:hypothetical protein